jgi:hypothetical protein
MRVLHHPPANVALLYGLVLLGMLQQVRDAGESTKSFQVTDWASSQPLINREFDQEFTDVALTP